MQVLHRRSLADGVPGQGSPSGAHCSSLRSHPSALDARGRMAATAHAKIDRSLLSVSLNEPEYRMRWPCAPERVGSSGDRGSSDVARGPSDGVWGRAGMVGRCGGQRRPPRPLCSAAGHCTEAEEHAGRAAGMATPTAINGRHRHCSAKLREMAAKRRTSRLLLHGVSHSVSVTSR